MTKGQLWIVLVTTFLVFCTLYTPQPILPQLAQDFSIPALAPVCIVHNAVEHIVHPAHFTERFPSSQPSHLFYLLDIYLNLFNV